MSNQCKSKELSLCHKLKFSNPYKCFFSRRYKAKSNYPFCCSIKSLQRYRKYTIYNIQYTINRIQYKMSNIQYTTYNIQYTIYNIQYTMFNWVLEICINSAMLNYKRVESNFLITISVQPNILDLQGVPRNMTIARRLESRLWYLNLFVTFSLLSTLTCMILETMSHNSPSLGISKKWSAFFVPSILPEIWRI